MRIRSNKELSFGSKLDAGWTKEQLMAHYSITEQQYEKIVTSLTQIRSEGTHK